MTKVLIVPIARIIFRFILLTVKGLETGVKCIGFVTWEVRTYNCHQINLELYCWS